MVTGSRDKTIKLWRQGEDGTYIETSTLVRARAGTAKWQRGGSGGGSQAGQQAQVGAAPGPHERALQQKGSIFEQVGLTASQDQCAASCWPAPTASPPTGGPLGLCVGTSVRATGHPG